jgi:excisionase family DNA binding protein
MTGCKECGGPIPPKKTSRGPKKKYCSERCMDLWHYKNGKHKYVKKNPDWGSLTPKREAEKKKRREEYEWYSENWLTLTDIGEHLGIHRTGVFHRAKKLGIKPKVVLWSGKKSFYSPEQAKQIEEGYQETPIPKGFLKKIDAAEYVGMAEGTFDWYVMNRIVIPDMEWQQTHGHRNKCFLYSVESLEEFKTIREKAEAERAAVREAKAAEREAREQALKEAATGRLSVAEVCILHSVSNSTVIKWISQGLVTYIKFNGAYYVDEDSVQEKPFYVEEHEPTQVLSEKERRYNEIFTAVSRCDNVSSDYEIERSRNRARSEETSERQKERWKNPHVKFRILVANAIKGDMKKNTSDRYLRIPVKDSWKALKEKCGYDCAALVKHIESQFTEDMTWDNHGRVKKEGEGFTWQIDHIKPRSSFNYTNFDDPEFAECWGLDNLRPLDARENVYRGVNSTLQKRGLKRVKARKNFSQKNSAPFLASPYKDYLHPSEVAHKLNVCEDTVRRWIRQGKISAAKISNTLYIHKDNVERPARRAWGSVRKIDYRY